MTFYRLTIISRTRRVEITTTKDDVRYTILKKYLLSFYYCEVFNIQNVRPSPDITNQREVI